MNPVLIALAKPLFASAALVTGIWSNQGAELVPGPAGAIEIDPPIVRENLVEEGEADIVEIVPVLPEVEEPADPPAAPDNEEPGPKR